MTDSLSKGEQTRQTILEAAYSLFIEQGFHATPMRQIAERAGLTVGAIYNHFESKEHIFDQVLLEKHPYRRLIAILNDAPAANMEEFVHNAANAITAELGAHPDFLKLAFIELSEFKGQHAPLLFQIIFPQFLPLIERFKSSQSELRDLPSQAVLLSFFGVFFVYYLANIITNTDERMLAHRVTLEQCTTIFLHGILKTEQP